MAAPTRPRVLILLLRRDLRLHDNPLFHALTRPHPYTHLLPLYIFSPTQIEVSGFLPAGTKSPFPETRSSVGKFWRCGPHRAKWIAESVWDLKESLKKLSSDLVLRVGKAPDVLGAVVEGLRERECDVAGVWMAGAVGTEEKSEEKGIRKMLDRKGVEFSLLEDTGYLFTKNELPMTPAELPDVFTSFRKRMEPLRETIPAPMPAPDTLPPLPPIPDQQAPFTIPTTLNTLTHSLQSPLTSDLPGPPLAFPSGATTAHSFTGGETHALARLHHLLTTGAITTYKDTRNGLLGSDFSTKLSGYLALGSISARRINQELQSFEDGKPFLPELTDKTTPHKSFGAGENKGTNWLRFELLWRDYFRLCAQKYSASVFSLSGYRNDNTYPWLPPSDPRAAQNLTRFLRGSTGTTLDDAAQRELYHTGYTSNRTRQNVASFLAKRLHIDWRVGAEWYECWLMDYDVCSNWGNWQYTAGVGNDPRGDERVFNQVKQAGDYDAEDYIKTWCEEYRDCKGLVTQAGKLAGAEREKVAAISEEAREMVENPCVNIQSGGGPRGGKGGGRGGGRGGKRGGGKGKRGERRLQHELEVTA